MTMKVKRTLKFSVCFFAILIVFSGCSSKPSLELSSASAELNNDEEKLGSTNITSEDNEDKSIVPIALSYEVILTNTGKTELGGTEKPNQETFTYDDGIQVQIEPNEKLKEVSEDVMGFNIYDNNDDEWIGIGETGDPVLEPDQKGTYTFDFILGAPEENPELTLAPPTEQLEKLEEHAMDAAIIVSIEGEEIARFNLNELD